MVRIDGERLLEDLKTLRGLGRSGTGVVHQAPSEADTESRAGLDGVAAAILAERRG